MMWSWWKERGETERGGVSSGWTVSNNNNPINQLLRDGCYKFTK